METGIDYSFDYLYKNDIATHVDVYMDGVIKFTNFTDDIMLRAFGSRTEQTISKKDLENLFAYRCVPQSRVDIKTILRDGDIPFYDRLAIIKKTHGIMHDDLFWIRFSSEKDLTWEKASEQVKRR
jgi:hypothetical protein